MITAHCISTALPPTAQERHFASLYYNNSVVGAQTGRREHWIQATVMANLLPLHYKPNFQYKFTTPHIPFLLHSHF